MFARTFSGRLNNSFNINNLYQYQGLLLRKISEWSSTFEVGI